jgi:rhodanese-related sulfurtransferase
MTSPTNENKNMWRMGRRTALVCVMLAAVGLGVGLTNLSPPIDDKSWRLDPNRPDLTLDDIEREVMLRYRLPDVSVDSLGPLLARGDVTLFDVRTKEEYEAGHIPGAIQVDPQITAKEFVARYGSLLKERPAVFYCAVGVRSSRVMSKLLQNIAPQAKAGLHNLRGGAFRWVADGRQLVVGAEPGQLHPFDLDWERLLKRTLAAR